MSQPLSYRRSWGLLVKFANTGIFESSRWALPTSFVLVEPFERDLGRLSKELALTAARFAPPSKHLSSDDIEVFIRSNSGGQTYSYLGPFTQHETPDVEQFLRSKMDSGSDLVVEAWLKKDVRSPSHTFLRGEPHHGSVLRVQASEKAPQSHKSNENLPSRNTLDFEVPMATFSCIRFFRRDLPRLIANRIGSTANDVEIFFKRPNSPSATDNNKKETSKQAFEARVSDCVKRHRALLVEYSLKPKEVTTDVRERSDAPSLLPLRLASLAISSQDSVSPGKPSTAPRSEESSISKETVPHCAVIDQRSSDPRDVVASAPAVHEGNVQTDKVIKKVESLVSDFTANLTACLLENFGDFSGEVKASPSKEDISQKKGARVTASETAPARHNATCDICSAVIVGTRYKCLSCPDWDSCQACYGKIQTEHPNHRFLTTSDPTVIPTGTWPVDSTFHSGIICDGCDSSIYGPRFKCVVCEDFDFCSNCEANPLTKHCEGQGHVFLKIDRPLGRLHSMQAHRKGFARWDKKQNKGRQPHIGSRFAPVEFGLHHTGQSRSRKGQTNTDHSVGPDAHVRYSRSHPTYNDMEKSSDVQPATSAVPPVPHKAVSPSSKSVQGGFSPAVVEAAERTSQHSYESATLPSSLSFLGRIRDLERNYSTLTKKFMQVTESVEALPKRYRGGKIEDLKHERSSVDHQENETGSMTKKGRIQEANEPLDDTLEAVRVKLDTLYSQAKSLPGASASGDTLRPLLGSQMSDTCSFDHTTPSKVAARSHSETEPISAPAHAVISTVHDTNASEYDDEGEDYDAKFIRDVTMPDGSSVVPGSRFDKVWLIENTGKKAWLKQTSIVFVAGHGHSHSSSARVRAILGRETMPGQAVEVCIRDMIAPHELGMKYSYFRLERPETFEAKIRFGQQFWVATSSIVSPQADKAVRTESDLAASSSSLVATQGGEELSGSSFIDMPLAPQSEQGQSEQGHTYGLPRSSTPGTETTSTYPVMSDEEDLSDEYDIIDPTSDEEDL